MNQTASKSKAAMWMAGWLLQLLMIAVAGREALRELNVFQVSEFRSAIGLLLILPLIYRNGGFAKLATKRPVQHIARSLVQYVAQLGWFFALTLISLGEVVAIEFTTPIWTAMLAAVFLKEQINPAKILAIALGVIGVVMIVRPGLSGANPGQVIALGAAIFFGIAITMMKSLTRTEPTLRIIFWMAAVQSVAGLLPAIYVWTWPSAQVWGWVIVVAFCGTFSHYCMARAMLHADATIVVPMDFLRVPLTALAGWLIYAEQIDLLTALGAALILGGNLLNLRSPSQSPVTV